MKYYRLIFGVCDDKKKTTYKIKLFVFTVWSTNAIDFSIKTPNYRNTRTFNIGVCLWERL